MVIQELAIKNKGGLHARPASMWVQTANKYKSSIHLKKGEKEVDGKSLLGILSLGLSAGSIVQLIVDGTDEMTAANDLEQLVANLEA